MRIKASGLLLLFTLLIGVQLFHSCTPESCLEETTAFLNASFYQTGSSKPTIADSVTIYGIGKETNKLYDKALKVSVIKLPMDASSESCGFVFKINGTVDTLNLKYSAYPYLLSKECGVTFFYKLDSCLWNGTKVDTIIIRNNNIATFNGENIRIFY